MAEVVKTPPPPDELTTNDFGLSAITLKKTPGASLVYVTGQLHNLAARQRFGVKLEFELFDKNNQAVGRATDYLQILEPHASWNFKALVLDSKAATAHFRSILEDQ